VLMKVFIINRCAAVLLLIVPILTAAPAAGQNTFEARLADDMDDQRLDEFSRLEAALILSGISSQDSLKQGVAWYQEIVHTVRQFPVNNMDRIESANRVFSWLHATWLHQYGAEATTLLDIIERKMFNCVSATVLYNLLCDDLGWNTEAFETPSHVYTIFTDFTDQVRVENTTSMGFDIMKNLQRYSRYLAQFYPQSEVLRIGLDKLYAHENANGRLIDNTELLGLLAYNRSYFARKQRNFEMAYYFITLAQRFNADSRSNTRFEMGLYDAWGKQLFEQRNFEKCFSVYADAVYRYPEIKHFTTNVKAVFFNVLHQFWKSKKWSSTLQIIEEMLILECLNEADARRLGNQLNQWQHYASVADEPGWMEEIKRISKRIMNDQ